LPLDTGFSKRSKGYSSHSPLSCFLAASIRPIFFPPFHVFLFWKIYRRSIPLSPPTFNPSFLSVGWWHPFQKKKKWADDSHPTRTSPSIYHSYLYIMSAFTKTCAMPDTHTP
jgi:hypothetical protein